MLREMPYISLPIVLVHGIFMRDDDRRAWGRIPLWLSEGGNAVFFAGTDACSPVEVNARILASAIGRICALREVEAVHLVGFSRGGIDACRCAALLGQSGHIASITTLCTPHAGSFVARNGFEVLPEPAIRAVSRAAGWWAHALGDSRPDAYRVFFDLASPEDDANLQDSSKCLLEGGVYCQSYALASARPRRFSFMKPVGSDNVPNDGLVAARSAIWANYRGEFYPPAPMPFDVKHEDMVDAHRKRIRLAIRRPDGSTSEVGDLRNAWCLMMSDLKEVFE